MAHARKGIREAVKARLVGTAPNYKTSAGARVFETRFVPFRRLELPAIAVYTLEEAIDPASTQSSPRELKRTMTLIVEAVAQSLDNVDDSLDAIAEQIECALHLDETFGGKAADSILASTDFDLMENGDQLLGVVRLVYTVTYYTFAISEDCEPEYPIFESAEIRHNLSNAVHPDNHAVDILDDVNEEEDPPEPEDPP